MTERFLPADERILVKQDSAPEQTKGGIILSPATNEKLGRGTVITVGPGRRLESGERSPVSYTAGDVVMFGLYSGTKVELNGEELLVIREDDLLGKVKQYDPQ